MCRGVSDVYVTAFLLLKLFRLERKGSWFSQFKIVSVDVYGMVNP
jgi:hypothetical protein